MFTRALVFAYAVGILYTLRSSDDVLALLFYSSPLGHAVGPQTWQQTQADHQLRDGQQ